MKRKIEIILKKQKGIWLISNIFLKLFFGFKVLGLENITSISLKIGLIFASNHTGWLDVLYVPSALPYKSKRLPIFYVTRPKKKYQNIFFKLILGGNFAKNYGGIPTSQIFKKDIMSLEKVLSPHIKILNNANSLLIYPKSGIRGIQGKKLRTMPGVAFLMNVTKCPIIPVFILKEKRWYWFSKITIIFGKPIYQKDFNNIMIKPYVKIFDKFIMISEKIMNKVENETK